MDLRRIHERPDSEAAVTLRGVELRADVIQLAVIPPGAVRLVSVGQNLSERIVQTRPPAPQFSLGTSFVGVDPTGPWVITPTSFASSRASSVR